MGGSGIWEMGQPAQVHDKVQTFQVRIYTTIEMFVLSHIFSKIEGAYQAAVALKSEEELIREEKAMLLRQKQNKQTKPNRKLLFSPGSTIVIWPLWPLF